MCIVYMVFIWKNVNLIQMIIFECYEKVFFGGIEKFLVEFGKEYYDKIVKIF